MGDQDRRRTERRQGVTAAMAILGLTTFVVVALIASTAAIVEVDAAAKAIRAAVALVSIALAALMGSFVLEEFSGR